MSREVRATPEPTDKHKQEVTPCPPLSNGGSTYLFNYLVRRIGDARMNDMLNKEQALEVAKRQKLSATDTRVQKAVKRRQGWPRTVSVAEARRRRNKNAKAASD